MTGKSLVDLDAVVAGERRALHAWLDELGPRLVLWSATRLSPKLRALHGPEDVAQEILAAVVRDLPRIGPKSAAGLLPWVYTVAENRIRDLANAAARMKRSGDPPPAPRQSSPSSIVSRREETERMLAAIDRLSDSHREVIRLRRFEELPPAEVARRMGRTENAVRILFHRATRALATEMDLV